MSARRKPKHQPIDPPPATANPEAEAALLGMILADERRFHDVMDRLKPEDFSTAEHQTIWRGMCSLVASGRSIIRQVLLAEIGEETKDADEIGLAGKLRAIHHEGKGQTGSILDFLEAIKAATIMRDGIAFGEWIKDEFSKAKVTNNEEVLAEAKHRLSLIGTGQADDGKPIGEVAATVVAETIKVRNKEKPPGLKTGLTFIDSLVGALYPGQLIVIAGSAGMGKTALGMQIAMMLAQAGYPTHAFSLEMESEEVAARMLASFSKVGSDKIADGNVTDDELAGIVDAERSMRDLPFLLDARTKPTTGTLLARASRSVAKHGTRLFLTDHLRMVRPDSPKQEERERIEQIVQDHKSMAKKLGVPWILLAHTQRMDMSNIKTAKDIRKPQMGNLYGSSAVENTADIVLFVHRPWMILQDVKPSRHAKHYDDWTVDVDKAEGKAEIILSKRRGGKGRGIRSCRYDAAGTWFREKEEDQGYKGEVPI